MKKLDILQDAGITSIETVNQQAMYDPDGFIDGFVTIKIKKWVAHNNVEHSLLSLNFNEARKLRALLEQKLAELDTRLYLMKEQRKKGAPVWENQIEQ